LFVCVPVILTRLSIRRGWPRSPCRAPTEKELLCFPAFWQTTKINADDRTIRHARGTQYLDRYKKIGFQLTEGKNNINKKLP